MFVRSFAGRRHDALEWARRRASLFRSTGTTEAAAVAENAFELAQNCQ